jgi:hypothetical protein
MAVLGVPERVARERARRAHRGVDVAAISVYVSRKINRGGDFERKVV